MTNDFVAAFISANGDIALRNIGNCKQKAFHLSIHSSQLSLQSLDLLRNPAIWLSSAEASSFARFFCAITCETEFCSAFRVSKSNCRRRRVSSEFKSVSRSAFSFLFLMA